MCCLLLLSIDIVCYCIVSAILSRSPFSNREHFERLHVFCRISRSFWLCSSCCSTRFLILFFVALLLYCLLLLIAFVTCSHELALAPVVVIFVLVAAAAAVAVVVVCARAFRFICVPMRLLRLLFLSVRLCAYYCLLGCLPLWLLVSFCHSLFLFWFCCYVGFVFALVSLFVFVSFFGCVFLLLVCICLAKQTAQGRRTNSGRCRA